MTVKKISNKRKRSKDVEPKKTNLNVKTIIILAVIAIVVIVAAVYLFTGKNGSTSNGNSNINGNTNGDTNNTNGDTNVTLKNILIGSWIYIDEGNKTMIWTFYDNDSLESEFSALGGTHFTTWNIFKVYNDKICFTEIQTSDNESPQVCYEYEFSNRYYTQLTVIQESPELVAVFNKFK